MAAIDNLDFLNLNSLRSYPIKDGLSRISVDGSYTIPNNFIVDAQLAASYDPTRRFYISGLSNPGDRVVIELADQLDVFAGSFTIMIAGFVEYTECYFTPSTNYVGATGILTIGSLDGIGNLPTGLFNFTLATTELEARAIIPALEGINRLIFQNADGTTVALTGDVQLLARTNLRFKKDPSANRIIIDGGDGLGLNANCAAILPCITTINGVPPDDGGNFTLDFSDCASLETIPAGTGLILSDICCKPCMGCNDIEELTNRLTQVESALLTLRDYYNNLNQLFDNYKVTINYTCAC